MSLPLSSAATPRSSSLNVPATQNTAPVVKFRCLFTHDMRRKAKRWQDGFLRYHTFNKRVMVYDNTGYFIGDLHWRAPEGIQDGDELELDKGVLIQVCEPLEQTETDLSALYQNKSQNSPSQSAAPPSSVRSTPRPPPSQQAARSLNDLLGIKKTGAPRLISPYEQRNTQRSSSTQRLNERPAKRQRTSPQPSGQGVVDLSDSPPSSQQQSVWNPRPEPSRRQNHSISASEQRLPKESSSTTKQRQALANRPPNPPASSGPQDHSIPASAEQRLPKSSNTAKQLQAPSNRPSNPPVPQSNSSSSATSNTLRLASSKPRRKLMYQEPAAPLESEPRSQLSRTQSQSARTPAKPQAPTPVIVLDDDEPAPEQPSILRPARADLTRSVSMMERVGDTTDLLPFETSSDDEFPHITNASVPLPQPGPSAATDQPANTARPRSTGLRKSFSDPTTINIINSRPPPTTSPLNPSTDTNDDQGPWTSEALDLFDFWPPGRPKPV